MILLDTNLLTRMTRSHDPQSRAARTAIQTLRRRGERLIVVPQNLYEFWAVATQPAGAWQAGSLPHGWKPLLNGRKAHRFHPAPDADQGKLLRQHCQDES